MLGSGAFYYLTSAIFLGVCICPFGGDELFCIYATIATVDTVAEILKNSGFAVEKNKAVLLYMSRCLAITILHDIQ